MFFFPCRRPDGAFKGAVFVPGALFERADGWADLFEGEGGLWKVGVVGGHEEGREERRGGLRRGEGEGCPAFEEISRWRLSKSSVSKMERLQEEVRGKGCRVSVKPVLYCRNWMAHFFFFSPSISLAAKGGYKILFYKKKKKV